MFTNFKKLNSHRVCYAKKELRLEINKRKKIGKPLNTWMNTLLNNQWVKDKDAKYI